MNQNVGRMPT